MKFLFSYYFIKFSFVNLNFIISRYHRTLNNIRCYCYFLFSLLVLEGVIIESRTEPRSRVSLLLPSPSNERFSLISLVNVDRRFSISIAIVEK
ncbi:unnamed protein product [Tenebrio molitor]|nr:unnamed protein product [Tenebrio molitor]